MFIYIIVFILYNITTGNKVSLYLTAFGFYRTPASHWRHLSFSNLKQTDLRLLIGLVIDNPLKNNSNHDL